MNTPLTRLLQWIDTMLILRQVLQPDKIKAKAIELLSEEKEELIQAYTAGKIEAASVRKNSRHPRPLNDDDFFTNSWRQYDPALMDLEAAKEKLFNAMNDVVYGVHLNAYLDQYIISLQLPVEEQQKTKSAMLGFLQLLLSRSEQP